MGLLKHVLLPLLTLADGAMAILVLVLQTNDPDVLKMWNATEPLDDLAQHLLHAVGATFLALGVNNVVAAWKGNAWHRATAVALHGVFALVDGWSYVQLGRAVPGSIYAMVAMWWLDWPCTLKSQGYLPRIKHKRKQVKRSMETAIVDEMINDYIET